MYLDVLFEAVVEGWRELSARFADPDETTRGEDDPEEDTVTIEDVVRDR